MVMVSDYKPNRNRYRHRYLVKFRRKVYMKTQARNKCINIITNHIFCNNSKTKNILSENLIRKTRSLLTLI